MADDSPSRNRPTEHGLAIARELIAVAHELDRTPAQVALAGLWDRSTSIIPIIGARHPAQLEENLGCLSVEVTDDQRLDDVSRVELGFPHDFLLSGFLEDVLHGDVADRVSRRTMPHRGVLRSPTRTP
jgi:hypothetical protein